MVELINFDADIVTYSGEHRDKNQFVKDCKRGDNYACTALLYYTRTFPKYVKLPGGAADFKTDNEFDEDQLIKGIQVELIHTKSPYIAKELAKDNLVVDPRYYDHLDEMRDQMAYRTITSLY